MRTLDFAVELRRAGFDVGMSDALVFDVPVKLGLELVTIVGANFSDPEGELLNGIVDETDSVGLGMLLIDLEGAHAGPIVDGRELKPAYLLATLTSEGQKPNVHLNMVARDLFGIAFGVDLSEPRPPWQPVETMTSEDPVDAGVRDLDAVIALQVPDDPDGPQMVLTPAVQDLFLDVGRCSIGMPFRYRLGIDETRFSPLSIG